MCANWPISESLDMLLVFLWQHPVYDLGTVYMESLHLKTYEKNIYFFTFQCLYTQNSMLTDINIVSQFTGPPRVSTCEIVLGLHCSCLAAQKLCYGGNIEELVWDILRYKSYFLK